MKKNAIFVLIKLAYVFCNQIPEKQATPHSSSRPGKRLVDGRRLDHGVLSLLPAALGPGLRSDG